MERVNMGKQILSFLQKNRYMLIVLLIGIVLMLIPGRKNNEETTIVPIQTARQDKNIAEELENILGKIEGVGKVSVMLTVAVGEQTIYQTDNTLQEKEDAVSTNDKTVVTTDASRNQIGLVRQVHSPIYQGAVIVCQGADNPKISLAVTQAVSGITGLKTDCITVLKMK